MQIFAACAEIPSQCLLTCGSFRNRGILFKYFVACVDFLLHVHSLWFCCQDISKGQEDCRTVLCSVFQAQGPVWLGLQSLFMLSFRQKQISGFDICQVCQVWPHSYFSVVINNRGLSHPYSCLRERYISFWSLDTVLACITNSNKRSHVA